MMTMTTRKTLQVQDPPPCIEPGIGPGNTLPGARCCRGGALAGAGGVPCVAGAVSGAEPSGSNGGSEAGVAGSGAGSGTGGGTVGSAGGTF